MTSLMEIRKSWKRKIFRQENEGLDKRQIKWKYWSVVECIPREESCIANQYNFQESFHLLFNYPYEVEALFKKWNLELYHLSNSHSKVPHTVFF